MTPIESDPNAGLNGAVAGELRATRSRRQTTNEQIAERSDIPLVSVNRYMAGKRPIKISVLAELAAALDVDPAVIVRAAMAELEIGTVIQGEFGKSSYPAHTVDESELADERSAAQPPPKKDVEGESEGETP